MWFQLICEDRYRFWVWLKTRDVSVIVVTPFPSLHFRFICFKISAVGRKIWIDLCHAMPQPDALVPFSWTARHNTEASSQDEFESKRRAQGVQEGLMNRLPF